MVAKITTPKSIMAALNYNEKKVQRRSAVCLHATNYLSDARNMNFYQKLNGFERLNSLNERAATKTLHVSLNFCPTEKLGDSKLIEIASMYMDTIGFGEQPFLIYKLPNFRLWTKRSLGMMMFYQFYIMLEEAFNLMNVRVVNKEYG